MSRHDGSTFSARNAPTLARVIAAICIAVPCLLIGLGVSVASAAPAAPVISGPTAIQFAYHPAGFRATIAWDPVPTATAYQIYDADTQFYVGSVTGTTCVVYGMQGALYHHYVVAVDSIGATSTPSNIVDILTSAPVPPALPAPFEVLPMTVFAVESSSAGTQALPVKIPFDPAQVTGDVSALRMLHLEDGTWTDVTTSVDTTRNLVLGSAAPTSVFAVVEVTGPVTLDTTTTLSGPSVVKAKRGATFTGSVTPAAAFGTVVVERERWVGGTWVPLVSVTATVADGGFSYRFAPSARGTWRVRATYSGVSTDSAIYAPSTSGYRLVIVR